MILFRILLFLLVFLLPFSSLKANDSRVDILVFAPHPDDETLGCGQKIIQAIKERKKVKVVFLTNGDGSTASAVAFFRKPAEQLTARDYIALGEERQQEALRAAAKLGLSAEDLIFLSYPDTGLIFLWGMDNGERYKSELTGETVSVYQNTWGRARSGYLRKNLIQDLKDIFQKYQPQTVYAPSPIDKHKDHAACANFLNKALDEQKREEADRFVNPQVFYYIIHSTYNSNLPVSSGCSSCQKEFSALLPAKSEALKEYRTQLVLEEMKKAAEYFVLQNESFNQVPVTRDAYLSSVYREWSIVGGFMKGYGYNINLGIIADVAADINNPNIDLVKKEKIFSDDPESVSILVDQIVQAQSSQGIIPVVKHFPGLGSALNDTHKWLSMVRSSSAVLNEKDLLPYRELIRKNRDFWIMISHAIYPALDDKPASLSYKIQTQILRNKLGFKGLIIADELLAMQAIEEYALRQGIPQPFIGEIAALSFTAGTDIVIIYPTPEKAEEVILNVVKSVSEAVRKGRITEAQINDSVTRILKEKERLFSKPLVQLLKDMSLKDKICQKIIIDTCSDPAVALKFTLGGIHAREYKVIPEVQAKAKIPFFVAGQHEGGRVVEGKLNLYSPSAYLTGREFERTQKPKSKKCQINITDKTAQKEIMAVNESFFDFNQLPLEEQAGIIAILSGSIDGHIKFYSDILQNKVLSPPSPDYLSPLTIIRENYAGGVKLKDFSGLPAAWLRNFPDRNTAICAYDLFKETFQKWEAEEYKIEKARDKPQEECQAQQMISKLKRLQETLGSIKPILSGKELRVLCLAAHPDDEDAEGLVYFKKRFNAKTFILLATRGEAGENEISPVLYDDLGFLRTEEIERAAAVLGVDRVYYLGKKDFGYCFDPQVAFKNWDRQDTLSRLVYFFRLIKPDVIITKYGSLLGHCQHRAMNILGQEAFDQAGTVQAFPEMIRDGLPAWQAKRFYQGQVKENDEFPLEEIMFAPQGVVTATGKTYRQIAGESLAEHKSQGDMSYTLSCPVKASYELVKEADARKHKPAAFLPGGSSVAVPSGLPGIKIADKLQVGLIEENDNILFVSLKTLGCDFKRLDKGMILSEGLSGIDTILIGKGADRLLADQDVRNQLAGFVEKGGNLVVLFQPSKPGAINAIAGELQISFDAVSDPQSPVTILASGHTLFNWPNKVSPGDFSGWTQARGLLFPTVYGRTFLELTSCPGAKSGIVKGGYLISGYGQGSIIFSAYAWYRQFRDFHLGAMKNLANMISYPLKRSPADK